MIGSNESQFVKYSGEPTGLFKIHTVTWRVPEPPPPTLRDVWLLFCAWAASKRGKG